jgi:hypothetical protein
MPIRISEFDGKISRIAQLADSYCNSMNQAVLYSISRQSRSTTRLISIFCSVLMAISIGLQQLFVSNAVDLLKIVSSGKMICIDSNEQGFRCLASSPVIQFAREGVFEMLSISSNHCFRDTFSRDGGHRVTHRRQAVPDQRCSCEF